MRRQQFILITTGELLNNNLAPIDLKRHPLRGLFIKAYDWLSIEQ